MLRKELLFISLAFNSATFTDPSGMNSLVWDALFNSNSLCLLSHDISHDQMRCLLLHWAAQEGKLDLIQEMINHGVHVDLKDTKGQTALFVAVRNNYPSIVKALLEAGADANAQDNRGRTALCIVDTQEEIRPCAERIEVITIKSDSYHNWIPIYFPPDDSYEEVTRLLLAAGSDPTIKDYTGRTPLHWAAVFGRKKVVALLLEAGANINEIDGTGGTALCEAAAQGYEALVKFLVNSGADVNTYDNKKGQSPVACAALFGRTDIVRYLLDHGVSLQRDSFALYAAALAGYVDIMELLLERGANTEITYFDGKTVLTWVALQGDLDMAQLLLKHGANHTAKDMRGQTPLDLACAQGRKEIVELLLEHQEKEAQKPGCFYLPFF